MNLNSLSYLCFLPVTVILYFILPRRVKNPVLLAASYFFYACWSPWHTLLLLLSTAVSYGCGRLLGRDPKRKTLWVLLTLGVNLGMLIFFKYFNFLSGSLFDLLHLAGVSGEAPTLNLLLPAGISFFTFRSIGYVLDVAKGKAAPEKSFIDYALFVSFFPQLAAGPIERAGDLLPQLQQPKKFSSAFLREGALLLLWGLVKKVLIADNLAVLVNRVYGDLPGHTGMQILFASLCFAVQIYCDFSGYTDLARGSAALFGIRAAENFKAPYFASSVQDFWRRWHISLSTWFRDYLYFPLGGSRVPKWRHCLNVVIVFAVSGLWHGAALTFLVWGLLHGLFQVMEILLRPARQRLDARFPKARIPLRIWRTILTLGAVCLAWIFFRADTLSDALYALKSIFTLSGGLLPLDLGTLGLTKKFLAVLGAAVLALFTVEGIGQRVDLAGRINRTVWLRYALYTALLLGILIFGYYGSGFDPQDFVYFKF